MAPAAISAVEILDELKQATPDAARLQTLRDRIEEEIPDEAKRTTVFEQVARGLDALSAVEKTLVQANLKELEKKTARNTSRASLDALRTAVNRPAVAPAAAPLAPATTLVAPVAPAAVAGTSSIGNALEKVADSVLPSNVSARMSRGQKIAAVTVGTLGIAVAIAALWKGWKGVKKTVVWGGVAIAGAIGLTWLADKISLAGGLKAAGQKVLDEANQRLKEARYLAFPWEKYGLTRAAYKEASKIYADKKEAGADEIRNRFFAGKATPEYELFMKDRREEAKEAEPTTDENGVEKVSLSEALPNYYQAINDSLKPFTDFCVRNKEGIIVVSGVTLAVSPAARAALTGSVSFTANRIKALLEFFGGLITRHPILSVLAALGTLHGIKTAAHMRVPKDPANLQKFLTKELSDAGDSVGDFASYLPAIPQEDWNMISGILQGSGDAAARLAEQTKTLFESLATRGLESVALSPTEEIEQENKRGLSVFLGFLGELKMKDTSLNPKFDAISNYVTQLKYPLTKADIEKITELSKDFEVSIEEVGGLYMYGIRDENDVLHTRALCINPEISADRQASLARTFIIDAEDGGELTNQLGQPLRQVRSWADFIFFNGAKNEQEAAQLLENQLLGNKGAIVARGGYAFLYTVAEGGVKKILIGPFETTVKPLFKYMKGDFSSTEMLLDYTEGLLPVYVFSTTVALAKGKLWEAFGWKPLLRTAVYPIEGTVEAFKLLGKSIVWPTLRGRFSEILKDQRIMMGAGFNQRIAQMRANKTSRIPTMRMASLSTDYRKLAALEEARGLLAKARSNLVFKLKYVDAAQVVLNRVAAGLDAGELAKDASALDDAIVSLRKNILSGVSTAPVPSTVPPPTPPPVVRPAPPPPSAPRPIPAAPAATVNVPKTKAAADEELLKKALAKFKSSGSTASLDFLKLADADGVLKLNPDVLALVKQSPGAQNILDGALAAAKGGDFSELTRAMKAANVARNWRIGLNGVGVVGDIFGIAMAMADFKENGCKIEQARQTQNQALIDLYSQMRVVNAVEGASSAASLGVGVTVMVQAYWGGQSIMTAISASGGLIMLPVAVAVAGGGYMARKAAEVTEKWSRTSKDWVQVLSPGEILQKLDEIGPGQRNNKSFFGAIDWDEWGKGTIVEQGFRAGFTSRESYEEWEKQGENTIERANNDARYELTKAYVIHSSAIACQPEPGESDDAYEKRFDQFVIDQMSFIGNVTQQDYSLLLGDMYEQCRVHAELKAKSRKLRAEGKTDVIEWIDAEGEKRSFDFANYEDTKYVGDKDQPSQMSLIGRANERSKSMAAFQIVMMTNMAPDMPEMEKKAMVKQQLVLHLQESINKLNGRIENTDFNGVMGWDTWGKGAARMAFLQLLDEKLEEVSGSLLGKITTKDGLGIADMDAAIQTLRGFCDEQDILKFQAIADDREIVKKGEMLDPAKAKGMLSVQGVLTRVVGEVQEQKLEKKREQEKQTMTPQEIAAKRKESGETYLFQNQITNKGDYSQVQFGQWFNKYLYMKFIDDTWQVSFGNYGNGPWKDPDTISVSVGNEDTTGKYNKIIWELAKINSMYR